MGRARPELATAACCHERRTNYLPLAATAIDRKAPCRFEGRDSVPSFLRLQVYMEDRVIVPGRDPFDEYRVIRTVVARVKFDPGMAVRR